MEWTETEKGGLKLLLDGFVYVKKKNLANGWESYECELRRNRSMCKARVKVLGADQFRDKTEHNHPPDHGKAEAYKLKAAIKRRAVSTDESPQQILMTTIHHATEEGLMALPEPTNMRRIIRRQRQDHRESQATRNVGVIGVHVEQRSHLGAEDGVMAPPGVHSVRQNDREALVIGNDLEVPKDQKSPFGTGERLIAPPLVDSVCEDGREALVVGNEKIPEDQRSSLSPKGGPMAPPGPDNMRNDSQEALAIKNGLELPGDQMSPLNIEKDSMTLPGLDSMRQNNIMEGPEDHKLSLATGKGPVVLPRLGNMFRIISRKPRNKSEALSVPKNSGGLELNVSPEIVVRPLHSTLLKRPFGGHQSTSPRAKVPISTTEIDVVPNLPVTRP